MQIINSSNPNGALAEGIRLLLAVGETENSRNGPVCAVASPVTTITKNPAHRVVFSAVRDANPFFHLMEALWMLAGRNDVALPAKYAKQLQLYSDDGDTLNGAYGFRWRAHFGHDQLEEIVCELQRSPGTRRCVLAMWCGEEDLLSAVQGSSDVPCNTHIYFRVLPPRYDGAKPELDMTVLCRSNDAIWGAHGANVVHFSFLQEYVAACAGLGIGRMYQISNNYHVYTERQDVVRIFGPQGADEVERSDHYASGAVAAPLLDGFPMVPVVSRSGIGTIGRAAWCEDVNKLLDCCLFDNPQKFQTESITLDPFLLTVALPMATAHHLYKIGRHEEAYFQALEVALPDWRLAAIQWFARRKNWEGPRAVGDDTVGGACD